MIHFLVMFSIVSGELCYKNTRNLKWFGRGLKISIELGNLKMLLAVSCQLLALKSNLKNEWSLTFAFPAIK